MAVGKLTYSFIVARTRNGVIGCENRMPWHLPSDLKQFKKVTLGKPIIMGRRTFDSIGRPLPGRPNIVVSRESGIAVPDVFVAKDKASAMRQAEKEAQRLGVDEVMVIGGEAIFDLFASEVSRVYLTEIDATLSGDAHFNFQFDGWVEAERRTVPADVCGDEYGFTFTKLERRQSNQKLATRSQCFAACA